MTEGHGHPVAAHEAGPTRERELEIDLLGADRPHEHLERRRRERRPHPVERLDECGEHGIALRHPVEAGEIEVETEDPAHLRRDRLARRRVADARDAHHETRVVHRAGRTDRVGHEPAVVPEHTQQGAVREAVRGIFSPQVVARERRAGVERSVRSENDVHRVVTRRSSVPELSRAAFAPGARTRGA